MLVYYWFQQIRNFHRIHVKLPHSSGGSGGGSKLLCANVLRTLRSHWSYALQLQHAIRMCVNSCIKNSTRAWPIRARIYYQKLVATIETMSKASERIKAYSCIAPSAAICYQYESAYFPAPYANNQLLCSLCGPKRSHAFNSAGFKHNNQV